MYFLCDKFNHEQSPFPQSVCLSTDEEPFLIFANRYYLRKLGLDGSNYTLIKQVGQQALCGNNELNVNHVSVFMIIHNQ